MNNLSAIADPTRAKILTIISRHGTIAAGEICGHFKISNAAISQHLKVLKEANLVNVEVDARRRLYSINREGIYFISNWVDDIKLQMENSINRLEDFLAQGKDLDS
ncbi:MAG: winged helix-turn-helix transcriptional regulator [Caulobacterales bacterium]|nr:winged helix-turn-helix transcriptional regulator [Caulobacterales bacterium]